MPKRWWPTIALTLALAGCGGLSTPGPTPAPTGWATAPQTVTPTTEAVPAPTTPPADPAPAATHRPAKAATRPAPRVSTAKPAPAATYRTAGALCPGDSLGRTGRTKLGVAVVCEHATAGDQPRWYRRH